MNSVIAGRMEDMPRRAIRSTWGSLTSLVTPEVAGSSKLEVTVIEINPETEPGPRHYHAEAENVFIILEGEVHLTVEDEEFHLGPMDFAWVAPGSVHQVRNAGAGGRVRLIEIYGPAGRDFHVVDDHPRETTDG